jgi:hypothetical protein
VRRDARIGNLDPPVGVEEAKTPRGEELMPMTSTRRSVGRVFVVVLLVGVAAAGVVLATATWLGGRDTGAILDQLGNRDEGGSRDRPYRSVAEAMRFADSVVVGSFTEVTPGRGFSWTLSPTGEEQTHEHEYGAEEAWINTVHAIFAVDEVLASARGSEVRPGSTVSVGIAIDNAVSATQGTSELAGLGTVVLYLVKSPVFDYQPELYAILEDGAFLATVSPQGALSYPLLDNSAVSVGDGRSVTDLRAAGD